MVSIESLRDMIVGVDLEVPMPDGSERRYINLDNAASTPSLVAVRKEANQVLDWYASVHRGAGYKSQLASEWYEEARRDIMEFVNADPDYHCVILSTNTTDSINRLARKFLRDNDRSVLISWAEHHANDLPWRDRGRVVRIPVTSEGCIDPDDLDHELTIEGNRARLVSITGASNVVGTLVPIHELARVAHKHGVPIAVDAAQLAPHVKIDMRGDDEASRIDFLYFSGHKMYAPFGGGVLIGPRDFFSEHHPAWRGGGAVLIVEPDRVAWAPSPTRDEAGSPNVLGAITVAAAARTLRQIGFETLEKREQELTVRFLEGLKKIPGHKIYGIEDVSRVNKRLGVIAFNFDGIPHGLVANALAHEYAIGVRNGCFCAQPFLLKLLNVTDEQALASRRAIMDGDRTHVPGAVRVSFGLYNTEAEVDAVLDALGAIAHGNLRYRYQADPATGAYIPDTGEPDYRRHVIEMRSANGR